MLKERARNKDHGDIRKEKDALYIFGTNAKVNVLNANRLGDDENLPESKAIVTRSGKPAKKPKLNNDGSIINTPLQYLLKRTLKCI